MYWDIYQLWQLLRKTPCDAETDEHLNQEILDSIKEHLQCKWDPTLLEESRHPASTPQAKYSTHNHANYDQLKDMMQCSCEEALPVAMDAH